MALSILEKYYNKFNEDKRLLSRHGQVEFTVSMKYIKEFLKGFENPKVIDIGAGTGRYSIALAEEGYDVTAVELVKHNLNVIKEKSNKVKVFQGNALYLKKFKDNSFDVTILFGPMYHLFNFEDKVKALSEAKRVTKNGGIIFVAYYMNEYCVLTYGFIENNIKKCLEKEMLTSDFHIKTKEEDLYSMVRIEDINNLNKTCDLKRIKIIATDGATDYIRKTLNKMDEDTFNLYIKYHLSICERPELLGASSHTLDILRCEK